jgi:2',3'-cyclic-nucleotide 2'-phosphodiesterase (5'-nucleotidase family)
VLLERAGRSLAVIGVAPGAGRAGGSGDHATASIAAVLPAVQAAQPDAILVAGDFDAACDSGCAGEAVTLLESLDSAAVHAVLGGAVATTVRGVPVVPVLAYGIGLSVVDVVRRRDGTLAIRPRVDTLWADAVTPDTTVRAVVRRHAGEVRRLLDRPVATLRFALAGAGAEALPLGRLLADAVRTAARGEVALVPTDAMHGDLPGGPVRVGDLLRLLPEPSPVVRLSVTGEALLAALERAVSGTAPSVHVAGLTVRYDPRRQPGRRVREARLDDGRRVERRRTYAVATTEALLAGTRGSETLGAAARESVRVSDRDALTRYLGLLQQPVEAPPTARFVVTR